MYVALDSVGNRLYADDEQKYTECCERGRSCMLNSNIVMDQEYCEERGYGR